jgi:Concanavalin A-like lectin/glucanases superfamily
MLACRFVRLQRFVALALLAALLPAAAQAANLLHRYTFNDGTIHDTQGAAGNGMLVDPMGIARFNAGRLDLTANNGAGATTDPITNGAYVDLPDGLFTSSVSAGTNGALSLEIWVNVQTNRANSRLWSFGDSEPGGGFPFWGQNTDWVDLNSQNGSGNLALTTHELGQGFNVNELQRMGPLPTGSLQHLVATFDQNDTLGGTNPDGTMRLYVNNTAVGTQAISPFLPIDLINDVNNYLGRSQWPDPFFDGQIDEFAIYDGALTPAEVSTRFATGPVPTPIPTFVVDRSSGEIRIENHTSINFNVKSYTITSAGGALDPIHWDSIADTGDSNSGSTFDPTGIWTAQPATANLLAESTPGNGGPLAATTGSRGLGDAWFRTPVEDLQVNYVLGDGSTGIADVSYVNNNGAPIARSDLNGDGSLTVADWLIFLAGSDQSFAGQSRVQSFMGGDINGDFVNDFRDFRLFQADYIAGHGAAAFAALLNGQVPEPSVLVLAALACLGLVVGAPRRKGWLLVAALVCASNLRCDTALAATPATYVASADPGLAPDANDNVDDAWTVTLSPTGGRGSFQGFAELGIGSAWAMYSYPDGGVSGTATADHTFTGGALTAGQSVRLDLANSAIAAGATVGVSLTSGGTPVATFKYVGNDPQGIYRYDDLGGTDQSTGEPFAYRTPAKFEFSVNSAGSYTAAYGLSAWNGTISGPVDGIRVFNNMAGDGSDVIFNNLVVGDTNLVPLSLEVNKSTGDVKLKGNPSLPARIDYYQITSAAGALDHVLWNSFDKQNLFAVDGDDDVDTTAGNSPTEGWDQAPNVTDSRLTEYFLRSGGATIANGASLSLGKAYDKSVFGAANGDLQFVYGFAGGARITGVVSYVTGGVTGDYNENGVVDAADYTVWRDHLGQMFNLPNRDLANGGAISTADYTSWKTRFGNPGSGGLAELSSVPEPAVVVLLMVGLLGLGAGRRPRRIR